MKRTNRLCIFIILVAIASIFLGGCISNEYNSKEASVQGNTNTPIDQDKQLIIHFIDVGQGDAILVQTPENQNMLIDAGDNNCGQKVIDYLQAQGIEKLDIVVGTHPHADHIGGLDTVIDNVKVENIYLPKVTHTSKSFRDLLISIKSQGLKINTAKAGILLPMDEVKAQFLAPAEDNYEDLNNYSAVIKLDFGNQSFLFTGDAEEESEGQILAAGNDIKATVLKVGHHGSYSSTSPEFLQAVKPQVAVIMVGQDNEYGHPHREILTRLKNAEAKLYRTDENGTVVISTDGNNLQINTDK